MDAEWVADLASQNDLGLETFHVPENWKEQLSLQGTNLQDAARRFRYDLLRELSGPHGNYAGGIVATAHHAMDQAETVLLAMFKGRNIDRISGLQSNLGLWRPWLEVMPSELEAYALSRNLHFRHDASNDSAQYDRNYLRLHLAPLLNTRFPGWVQGMVRASRLIRESQDLVSEFSLTGLEPFVERIQDPHWGKVVLLHRESRHIEGAEVKAGILWRSLGANYSQEDALEQAWALPVGKMLSCGKGRVFRHRNALCYIGNLSEAERLLHSFKITAPVSEHSSHAIDTVQGGGMGQGVVLKALAELGHEFSLKDANGTPLDWDSWLNQGWQVRPWVSGDQFVTATGHRKLVSDILQANGVQRPFKDIWPVICRHQKVAGCPLPSMSNQWQMEGGEGILHWEWKSRVSYAIHN
jgi:tRNA(Ile)-lysidine synthetase-like protein